MSQKIFLTGGTGLVGRALTDAFSLNNFEVLATYRTRKTSARNITWIKADLIDRNIDLHSYLKDVDVIIHNAASVKEGKTQTELDELKSVNIEFTERLLKAASSFDIKKIIFTSSFSFIKKPLPKVITEDAQVDPQDAYAQSKHIGEQLILAHCAKYNTVYNICRISSPISFDLDSMPYNVVKKWIIQSMEKQQLKVYGKGQRRQDFVSVTDIAQAYINCIKKSEMSGIFNIASGNTMSMFELAQHITSHFKTDFECIGEDQNEDDKWNISIDKATNYLNYNPQFTSEAAITALLNNISI